MSNLIGREYCGIIKYYGIAFDVHWDIETKKVYVSKINHPELCDIHFGDYLSQTKEDAPEAAIKMLRTELGDDIR